jgi:hypothetical protein
MLAVPLSRVVEPGPAVAEQFQAMTDEEVPDWLRIDSQPAESKSPVSINQPRAEQEICEHVGRRRQADIQPCVIGDL